MDRQYFLSLYRLDLRDRYLVWYTDETDGYVLDTQRSIPSFQTQEAAVAFANSMGLTIVEEEPQLQNLDAAEAWIKNKRFRTVDCVALLEAWNLLADISTSVGGKFDPDKKVTNKIYDKLFYGNNLPPVTPDGRSYHPIWSRKERAIIREVLESGISIFRNVVKCQ